PSQPWAQAASDVPADPAVRYGVLPNGMRYALLRNATPPGQASLRLRIDAGSLNERADQLGLAHFMEHMAFNGSTDIPEGELIHTLERLGLSFGADTNASTDFDETVYKLDLPRTDDATVDASLNILREMSGEATLAADAIDRERGVVLSEERTRDGPALRSIRARLSFLMKGQLVPDRFPIGDTSVLQSAPRERFTDFYDAFYRPERTTLIAVGDFDVDQMEAKIRAEFAGWTNTNADGAEPNLGAVQPRGPEASVFVDPGVQSTLQVAWVAPPDLEPDTLAHQETDIIRILGLQVLNRRFQALSRGATPPFIAASANSATNWRSQDTVSLYANVQPGQWKPALTALEQEQRRIVQYGVSQGELNREITEFRTSLQNAVAGAATRRTPGLANGLSDTVNSRTVFTAPQTDLAIFDTVVDGLTAETVNAALKAAFQGSGPLVFVTSPTAIEGGDQAVLTALAEAQTAQVAAPQAEAAIAWP
ncbi:MAG: insulinase family protein, partial [Brevundimonas sp.]